MPVSCEPKSLAEASACFCLKEREADAAMIYLLNQISELNLTPAQLAEASKCYSFDKRTAEAVKTYLLCQIANK